MSSASSASDLQLRTNKFPSVLFVVHAAGRDKHRFTDALPSVWQMVDGLTCWSCTAAVIDQQPAIHPELQFVPRQPAFYGPVRVVFPSEYGHDVWYWKTTMVCLATRWQKNLKIWLFWQNVQTWQTDTA